MRRLCRFRFRQRHIAEGAGGELELELLSAVWGAAHKGASLVRGPVRVVTGAPRRIFGWGTLPLRCLIGVY